MFEHFKTRRRNREIVEQAFDTLVEGSRSEILYTSCRIPDTVMGRFEALSIHVYLFLRRCREVDDLKPIAQDVVDRFITDIEASIRELGVGDPSVPKRMRKLAGIFYERVAAYEAAIGDVEAAARLRDAVKGRAVAADCDDRAAAELATYMLETARMYEAVAAEAILAGRFHPAPRHSVR